MSDSRISRHAILVTAITVLAIFLNGATSPVIRTAVIALMAVSIFAAPPSFRGGRWLGAFAIGAVLCSLTAFLPINWFGAQPWRLAATEIGIALPSTVSPNPFLSAQSICLLIIGLAWLYYLGTLSWSSIDRKRIACVLAGVSVLLGASYIAFSQSSTPWPRASYDGQFGPFANKNQTGSILMLGGILIAGLLNQPGQRRILIKLAWGLGLALVMVALVFVGSRSALILFACGAIFVSIRRATLPVLAIAGSVGLLAITWLITSNADVLDKFSGEDGVVTTTSENGRWSLYADSIDMMKQSPLTGVGAGNFEEVFALHRDRSAAPNRALHPDSDAVWLIAEFGLPATLLIAGFGIGLFSLAFPISRKEARSRRDHSLRVAYIAAASAFAVNALIDVPVHRFGSFLLGALVLALAINQEHRKPSGGSLQRFALGSCAALAACVILLIPKQASPLDANTYLTDAQNQLASGNFTLASAAFEKARFLRPDNAKLAFDEGAAWLKISPARAISAWRIALDRARLDGREDEMFSQAFARSKGYPEVLDELWLLAKGKPNLQVIVVERAPEAYLGELFQSNPKLLGWDNDQISRALATFSRQRSSDELLSLVETNPAWARLCWHPLADALAKKGDHFAAFKLISSACAPPDMSVLETPLNITALRSEFARSPKNLTAILRLAHQNMRRGNPKRALELLKTVDQPAPPIVQFMMAHCLEQQAEHELASEAMLTYAKQVGK